MRDRDLALSADADILPCGCDVAQHAAGRARVDTLARLASADVAAGTGVSGPGLIPVPAQPGQPSLPAPSVGGT